MEAARLADLHAYVDDCLEPDERLAFEQQMAQDPALARRAALWRTQNNAIRTAFDGESARAFPISIVRHQNEAFGRAARSEATGAKPSGEQPRRRTLSAVPETRRPAAKILARDRLRPWLVWRVGLAVLSVCLAFVWAPAATVVPGERLGQAGVAAFRAFARSGAEPVEFATSDTSRSASVADDATQAPRLSPGHSLRPQTGRRADRALPCRLGRLCGLQVARPTSGVAGPIA